MDGDGDLPDIFLSEEFNAPKYVTDFLRSVRPGEEAKKLQALRQTLTTRSNFTADQIKDIVFDHYKQFIDTSKEIANLEREIHQLSSLLTEQKSLIEGLMGMSGLEKRSSCSTSISTTGTGSGLQNQQTHQMQVMMGKLDGVASVLNLMSEQERIVLQGQLVLLDPDTMQPKHQVYAVLLSNNFLIGHPNVMGGNQGPQKQPFHLVSNYPLETLALVNVKRSPLIAGTNNSNDSAELNLVQLLIFPDQLYFRCESSRIKREWLDSVEEAKRKQQEEKALVRQATIRARRRSILSSIASQKSSASPMSDQRNKQIHRIEEEENDQEEALEFGAQDLQKSIEDTAWLNELINELQDVISHRHMEEAVEMLLEWKSCGCKDAGLNSKFGTIEKQVVQILTDDVKRPGSLQGGSRALTQPIQQLIALGRSTYAIELYLRRRSSALRASAKEFTVSEEPLSYVRQVSSLFVNDIVEVFTECSHHREQLCLMLAWSSRELSILLSLIRRHVIEVAPTMAVLTNTWRILVGRCAQLIPIGLDLSFEVNRLAAPSLKAALKTNFENILESIKLRNSEERWMPYSLESDQNLIRFLEEMFDIGLQMEWAICQPKSPLFSSNSNQYRFSLNVCQSACMFARTALQLSRDLAVLNSSPHLQQLSDSFICEIWSEELAFLSEAVNQSSTMQPCAASLTSIFTSKFIVSQVLPLCEQVYQGVDTSNGLLHELLINKFPHLTQFKRRPSTDDENIEEEEVANV